MSQNPFWGSTPVWGGSKSGAPARFSIGIPTRIGCSLGDPRGGNSDFGQKLTMWKICRFSGFRQKSGKSHQIWWNLTNFWLDFDMKSNGNYIEFDQIWSKSHQNQCQTHPSDHRLRQSIAASYRIWPDFSIWGMHFRVKPLLFHRNTVRGWGRVLKKGPFYTYFDLFSPETNTHIR